LFLLGDFTWEEWVRGQKFVPKGTFGSAIGKKSALQKQNGTGLEKNTKILSFKRASWGGKGLREWGKFSFGRGWENKSDTRGPFCKPSGEERTLSEGLLGRI